MCSTSKTERAGGFTLVEVLVAVTVSLMVTGAAVYMFSETEKYRRQAERRMRFMAQWQSFQALFEREMRGLYEYQGGDLLVFNWSGSRLAFTTALENMVDEVGTPDGKGDADFVEVTYYMSAGKGGLCRKVRAPGQAAVPDDDKWIAFPDVRSFSMAAAWPGAPGVGLPITVTATLFFADPRNPELTQTWSATFYVSTEAP